MMTVEQAERIRQDMGLTPADDIARWWAEAMVKACAKFPIWKGMDAKTERLTQAVRLRDLRDSMEAFAVLHAAPVVAERDAARAEVERLRAAIRNAADVALFRQQQCPFCDSTNDVHYAGCPASPCPAPQAAVPQGETPLPKSSRTTSFEESLARSLVENRAVWQALADADKVGGTGVAPPAARDLDLDADERGQQ